MEFDSVLFRNVGKAYNLISVPLPLLAKHIVPEVEEAKTILTELTFQPEDVLYELSRMQMDVFTVVRGNSFCESPQLWDSAPDV